MKKIITHNVLFLVFAFASLSGYAQNQKIGYFESDFILTYIPEYAGIEQRLELLSKGWKLELSKMEDEINFLEEDYSAKEILYTQEIKEEIKKKIKQKKAQRNAYLNKKFGPDGEYFQSQENLIEPIYTQILTAVNEVAKKQGFDYVFDRSGDIYLVYARNEWNLNESILIELGIDIDE